MNIVARDSEGNTRGFARWLSQDDNLVVVQWGTWLLQLLWWIVERSTKHTM